MERINQKLRAEIDRLRAESARRLELLKDIEWGCVQQHENIERDLEWETESCPYCRGGKDDGHKPGCELKKEIGE